MSRTNTRTQILGPEQVREIANRANRATRGPWRVQEPKANDWVESWHYINAVRKDGTKRVEITSNFEYEAGGVASTPEDAAFIAAARTDVPDLVNTIRDLWAEKDVLIDRLNEALAELERIQNHR